MSVPAAPGGCNCYIRIKRHKQTIFLHCDLNDTVQTIKDRVARLITSHTAQQMRLLLGKQNLENHTSLYDCGIEAEDAELLLVYATGEETWEDWAVAMDGPKDAAPPAA
jgi:hypothetical protein